MSQSRFITETGTEIKIRKIHHGILIELTAPSKETAIILLSNADAKKLIEEINATLI